jgi:hypothetical protein
MKRPIKRKPKQQKKSVAKYPPLRCNVTQSTTVRRVAPAPDAGYVVVLDYEHAKVDIFPIDSVADCHDSVEETLELYGINTCEWMAVKGLFVQVHTESLSKR